MNKGQTGGRGGGTQVGAVGGSNTSSVPTSLLEAAIEVDEAIDEGGLALQEALARLHDELAPVIERAGGTPNRDIDERADS